MNINIRHLFQLLFALWFGFLLILSFYSPPFLHVDFPMASPDKYKHLLGALVLTLLFHFSFPGYSLKKTFIGWCIAGFVLELVQPVITGGHREFEFMDIVANVSGFGIAWLFIVLFSRGVRLERSKKMHKRIASSFHSSQ